LKLKEKVRTILAGKIHEDAFSSFIDENLNNLNSLIERQKENSNENNSQGQILQSSKNNFLLLTNYRETN